MKEITMKIRIDEKKNTTELRRVGCTVPEFMIWDDGIDAVAGAWRALAAYAMEAAYLTEHAKDFCPALFTNAERRNMAARICEEYQNLFEEEEVS